MMTNVSLTFSSAGEARTSKEGGGEETEEKEGGENIFNKVQGFLILNCQSTPQYQVYNLNM